MTPRALLGGFWHESRVSCASLALCVRRFITGHTVEGRPARNAKDLCDQRSFWRRGLEICEANQPGG